jgi:tRNA-dihydrouridine synthase B
MKKRYTLDQNRWDDPAEHAMPAATRVPASFRIGPVIVAPATVLAPMAGVTDTVFRRFIKNASVFSAAVPDGVPLGKGVEAARSNEHSGCGLIMTEFTSADGLSRMRESKRKRYLTYYDDEHPISAQIFGSNPETLAESARIIEEAGFDVVDLNLGCPAKRVVACNGGSGLLKDLPAIQVIFDRVRAAVRIPFTVKFRMGWNDAHIVCVALGKMAEGCGLDAVALHARTREDGYTGQARWEWIAAVKDAVRIPVIGNGDIRTPEDAAAMVDQTGCDAVMIGRTAPANPWIFRQIAQYTATGHYEEPTGEDRYRMIRTYFGMLLDEVSAEERGEGSVLGGVPNKNVERDCVGKMKQFASWFTHGVPGGAGLRRGIFEAKSGAAVLGVVEEFFAGRVETDRVEVRATSGELLPSDSLEVIGAGCD